MTSNLITSFKLVWRLEKLEIWSFSMASNMAMPCIIIYNWKRLVMVISGWCISKYYQKNIKPLGHTFNLLELIGFSFTFCLKPYHLIASEETEMFWKSLIHKIVYVLQLKMFHVLVVLRVVGIPWHNLLILFCLQTFLKYILPNNLSKPRHRWH